MFVNKENFNLEVQHRETKSDFLTFDSSSICGLRGCYGNEKTILADCIQEMEQKTCFEGIQKASCCSKICDAVSITWCRMGSFCASLNLKP